MSLEPVLVSLEPVLVSLEPVLVSLEPAQNEATWRPSNSVTSVLAVTFVLVLGYF